MQGKAVSIYFFKQYCSSSIAKVYPRRIWTSLGGMICSFPFQWTLNKFLGGPAAAAFRVWENLASASIQLKPSIVKLKIWIAKNNPSLHFELQLKVTRLEFSTLASNVKIYENYVVIFLVVSAWLRLKIRVLLSKSGPALRKIGNAPLLSMTLQIPCHWMPPLVL